MCGISGKLCFNPEERVASELTSKMCDAISHPGPDGRGQHLSGPAGLGHTRLAIIDLHTGAQPISNEDQTLFLARDRVGIKPLYIAETGRALVFGSEIKALLVDPEVKCEVDLQSVDKYLTHFCLPGKETLWKGITKIEPGYYLLARKG